MMADQRAREDSFRHPVQDLNNEADFAAELAKLLKRNPDLKAQVSEHLRHRFLQLEMDEAGPQAPPRGNNWIQIITSALQSLASGGFAGATVVFIYLWTALSNAIKMEGEIPKGQREEFDVMKRKLEGVEMKLRKVEQDVGNLKGAIRRAIEDDYKVSYAENKKLEIGFVTTKCDVDSCEDDFTCVREANARLQLNSILLIVGIILFMAAFIAGFLYHWMKTSIALASFLVAVGAFCKQIFLNNGKLLTECRKFKQNDLQKAELLAKAIKREVEVRLPLLKTKLDVLDINVSPKIKLL